MNHLREYVRTEPLPVMLGAVLCSVAVIVVVGWYFATHLTAWYWFVAMWLGSQAGAALLDRRR